MARFPSITVRPRDEDAIAQHHREEVDAGLEKIGPQWETPDDEEDDERQAQALLAAAGSTGYYEVRP